MIDIAKHPKLEIARSIKSAQKIYFFMVGFFIFENCVTKIAKYNKSLNFDLNKYQILVDICIIVHRNSCSF